MEPVAPDAEAPVPPRDRDDLRGPAASSRWKAVSKQATCGTPGTARADRLDQRDLPGQVFRVERGDPPQLVEHLRGDELRLDESAPPVDDAVPDGRDRAEPRLSSDPLDHQPGGRGLVRGLDRAILTPTAAGIADDQPGLPEPDPLDAAGEDPLDRVGRREDRELQAGRAAVDRQDVGP